MEKIKNIKEKAPGIYFIYDEDKNLMYIGKAINIRQRLIQHISPTWGDKSVLNYFHYADFEIIQDSEKREQEETRLINKLKPPLNRAKVNTYESSYWDLAKFEDQHGNWKTITQKQLDKNMDGFYL